MWDHSANMERYEAAPHNQWSGLPEGVLSKVAAQLPSTSQQSARLVCISWRVALAVQTVVSDKLTSRKLHNICREHPALKSINLSYSYHLTASSLRLLSTLTGLTYLSLSNTYGIGNVGRNSLAGLEALAQLRELNVSDMRGSPTAVERVCKLTGLTSLDMSGREGLSWLTDHLAAHLTKLTGLQYLSLRNTTTFENFDGISHVNEGLLREILEAFPHLTKVDLRELNIRGSALQAFQKHRILQTLNLAQCEYLTDLTGLYGLPNLSALDTFLTLINVYHPSLRSLPALTRLRVGVYPKDLHACNEDIGDLTMLHELVLVPRIVMMTNRWCDQLLQLSQLRVLDIDAPGYLIDRYNWPIAVGLFEHPGLTKLSWTYLQQRSASSDWQGEVDEDEDAVMVPPNGSWALQLEAMRTCDTGVDSQDGLITGQINLQEWMVFDESVDGPFSLVFTRVAARQA